MIETRTVLLSLLGVPSSRSRRLSLCSFARRAIHAAMVPTTDQTRTTGLVTLPGAGRFQIVFVTAWLAPVRVRPGQLAP